jgi:signal peptidase II
MGGAARAGGVSGEAGARPRGPVTRWLWGRHASIGLALAFGVFAVDQGSKTWLLWVYDIASRQPVEALPFLDLVLVWNRGVSYGLFQLDSPLGRALLGGFNVVAALGLWVWLSRTSDRLTAGGLALIVGGALGNAVDRFIYPGVADFFLLHLRAIGSDLTWYVFNVADAAIVAGVGALLYESLIRRPPAGRAPADRGRSAP